ncbi:AraC-like DNA-binding protein [Paenibacillus shirakamiensis]|uniref:AraC-like DNA-binding protein n=1 Tax=Paenibacillus shirakamiensis TaxID=1265935 RepID=A0ABS4JEF6_9BACL|nr:AraC family transcriptional regulator [Paenibacillus shirakamiensis]MBP2000078.1 AraC-like DNA-binding protein [Paenibacillus shirakamiensis]
MSYDQIHHTATEEYDISLYFVYEWKRDKEWNFHQYLIPVTTIWYILKGNRTLYIGDQEYVVKPGCIVILPSNQKVTTTHLDGEIEPITYVSMGIQALIGGMEWCDLFGVPVVVLAEEGPTTKELKKVWLELAKVYYRRSEPRLVLSASDIECALWLEAKTKLCLSMFIQLTRPSMSTPSPISDKRVREMCTYIREHYASDLSSKDLAAAVCLSEGHMRELFRRYMLMSPHQYILEVRMEKAKVFLGTSMLSLAEIAERVGFEDLSYFIYTFRKRECMTPNAYRKSLYPWKG